MILFYPRWALPGQMADAAVLALLRDNLTMDSLACQESALHGLGHWSLLVTYYQAQVRKIIDGYLAGLPEGAALRAYARAAAVGLLQ